MKILMSTVLTTAAAVLAVAAAVAGAAGLGVGALLGACACNRGRVSARERTQANGGAPEPAAGDAASTVGA